jgi:hypothetical protein
VHLKRRSVKLLALLLGLSLFAAACGDDDKKDDDASGGGGKTEDVAKGGDFIDLGTVVGSALEHIDPALNTTLDGYQIVNDGPVFDEITVLCPTDADSVRHALAKRGIIGGYALGREFPSIARGLVLCATERTTDAEVDRLVTALGELAGHAGKGGTR